MNNKFDILISIQPKWCEKIASGEKTIEVRKTRPKTEPPFKCYIYETKNTKGVRGFTVLGRYRIGKVIGEFICDKVYEYKYFDNLATFNAMGLPSGYRSSYLIFEEDYKAMCLSYDEVKNYGKGETLYGLCIADLKIYDKPKDLSDFGEKCELFEDRICGLRTACGEQKGICDGTRTLMSPPQSWCYVLERIQWTKEN